MQLVAWVTCGDPRRHRPGFRELARVAALAVVAAYGERDHITLRDKVNVSISLLPAIFAAVLFGPLAAMVVFGASAVLSLSRSPVGFVMSATGANGGSSQRAASEL